MPGNLLQLDFQKAFDTIEWKFIQSAIGLFYFSEFHSTVDFNFLLYYTELSLEQCFSTNYFALSREVRPGYPLLFVFAVELLAYKI